MGVGRVRGFGGARWSGQGKGVMWDTEFLLEPLVTKHLSLQEYSPRNTYRNAIIQEVG